MNALVEILGDLWAITWRVLTGIILVSMLSLALGFANMLLSEPEPEEPCVEVGQFDNGRTIMVCDAEAVRRWAR